MDPCVGLEIFDKRNISLTLPVFESRIFKSEAQSLYGMRDHCSNLCYLFIYLFLLLVYLATLSVAPTASSSSMRVEQSV